MLSAARLLFIFCIIQSMLMANEDEWKIVYLASFPRSGNHWVRFLVEEATHIATSSVYRDGDYPHLKDPFPWGGYCTDHGYGGQCRYPTKDDPVLLKTHYPYLPNNISSNPKLAICLIRNPIDAFWSFYVYRGGREAKMDKEYLMHFVKGWRKFYEFWENQPGVLFVRYEDLHANPGLYLSVILQTAGYSFSQTDIERAITKYSPQGMPLKHSGCYDIETHNIIKEELADILIRYNYEDI